MTLYHRISNPKPPLPLPDVLQAFERYGDIWTSLHPLKGKYPFDRIAVLVTEWHPISNTEYVAFDMTFDLMDQGERHCRVWEGVYSSVHKQMIETDAFLDIEFDEASIQGAVRDILEKKHRFPLWNRTLTTHVDLPWYALPLN